MHTVNTQSEGVRLLLIRHSKYSPMLLKIHSYRLIIRRFCPLGTVDTKRLPFFFSGFFLFALFLGVGPPLAVLLPLARDVSLPLFCVCFRRGDVSVKEEGSRSLFGSDFGRRADNVFFFEILPMVGTRKSKPGRLINVYNLANLFVLSIFTVLIYYYRICVQMSKSVGERLQLS